MGKEIVLTPEEEVRFWEGVDQSGGPDACWPWLRARDGGGYGCMNLRSGRRKAHRIAFTLSHGAVPVGEGYHGICVIHTCDNPSCCNPSHLRTGTQSENMRDCSGKGRLGFQVYPERYPDSYARSELRRKFAPRGERHGTRTHPERVARGERHGMARLSDLEVEEIRSSRADGEKVRVIAARYGISIRHVFKILSGQKRKAVV